MDSESREPHPWRVVTETRSGMSNSLFEPLFFLQTARLARKPAQPVKWRSKKATALAQESLAGSS